MDIRGWNERYRSLERRSEDLDADPTPLLVQLVKRIPAGKAIDLACGTGRNALHLAANGWVVTAVDGSEIAIDLLRERANAAGLIVKADVADLADARFAIAPHTWDLVGICYYLHRNLFAKAKEGVAPGGRVIAIAHTVEGGERPSSTRLACGELQTFFQNWEIEHLYEGKPTDPAHRRSAAEIVARKPAARKPG